MTENEEISDFGAGVVVCLVKFSEHLSNFWESQVHHAIRWTKMTDAQKQQESAEAIRHPYGDAANRMNDVKIVLGGLPDYTDERKISHYIELWMNGASDHFYDLDREKAPPSLIKLADLCLTIGHGFTGDIWTENDLKMIRHLWKQSCIEVDKMLGTKPDWGQW